MFFNHSLINALLTLFAAQRVSVDDVYVFIQAHGEAIAESHLLLDIVVGKWLFLLLRDPNDVKQPIGEYEILCDGLGNEVRLVQKAQ
jgi:hypothetical protein